MMKLTDAQFEDIQRRLNTAIHEIVYACKHAEDDNLDDACTALVTAQETLSAVNEEICRVEGSAGS